ncbi:MAG: serine/threonine-protein kinase [Myxococcales bacterium]
MLRIGSQLGRYRLIKMLGHGGMGYVYEAEHVDLGKHVAIKTLHPQVAEGPEGRARFLQEGRAAAMLRHPHICEVFDFGQEEDTLFLVMELLDGQNLDRFLDQQGLLTATETADLMLPVMAAVATMHDKGILHRDLKPANIFLAKGPYGDVAPKVLDFGIAKLTEGLPAPQTTAGMLGTAHYVSPEQVRGRPLDARSDQYSLGVIVYEMLTGAKPFDGANIPAIMQEIVNGPLKPPHHLVPDVPAAIETAVLKALSREAAKRHPSVFEFGAAVLGFASERTQALWAPVFEPKPPAAVARRKTGVSPAAEPPGIARRKTGASPAADSARRRPDDETGPLHAMETVPETAEDALRRAGASLIPTADKDAAERARTRIRESGKVVMLCQGQGPNAEAKQPLSSVLQTVAGQLEAVVFVSDPSKNVWQDPMEELGSELRAGPALERRLPVLREGSVPGRHQEGPVQPRQRRQADPRVAQGAARRSGAVRATAAQAGNLVAAGPR